MLIPLYGFAEGDSLGLLVLVQDTDSVATLGATLAQAAAVRVVPKPRSRVRFAGKLLDPALTVAESGLTPLARIDLVSER
jgi:hypothetical protein